MNALSRCRRIVSLVFHDPAIIAEAVALPLLLPLSFRFTGVPKTQAWLRNWAEVHVKNVHGKSPIGAGPDAVISSALRAQRVVKRTTGIGGSCLVRSLSLWAILRRRGVHSGLRVGMRRRGEKIEGHAWIEIEGIPMNENERVIRGYNVHDGPISFDRTTTTD
jgi:hypothetical protein